MPDTIKEYENEMENTFGCKNFDPGKKNIVIYSNCHGALIHKILSNQESIISNYNIFVLLCYIYVNKEDLTNFMEKIKIADIFIYQIVYPNSNTISTYVENPNCLLNQLNKQCYRFSIPNVQNSLFYLHRLPSLTDFVKSHCIINIIDPKNTTLLVKFGSEILHQSIELAIEKEKYTTIKIMDYIKNNIKSKRLFIDKLHPVYDVIFEITKRICKFSNLCNDIENIFKDQENPLQFDGKSLLSGIEMKVLNCNYISDEEIYYGNIILQQRIDDIHGDDNFGNEINKIKERLKLWEN